jgi:MinD superfamily P-loop ATPase
VKELVVISGKGGTGKTSILASFAALAPRTVLADCDVDASDLHLVLEPRVLREAEFSGGSRARILPEVCVGCAKCQQLCRFDAIDCDGAGNEFVQKTYRVDPLACEGCGVCAHFCPAGAIEFGPVVNGRWYVSQTRCGPMVHAELGIAEENSGKLVSLVRQEAKKTAEEHGLDMVLVDGAPGIGCPVIASISASNLVLIVTEPTLSGLHDLERVADMSRHFGIETLVAINKADLNAEVGEQIEWRARERGLSVVGKVRYDRAVTEAQMRKQAVVEYTAGGAAADIRQLWSGVSRRLTRSSPFVVL